MLTLSVVQRAANDSAFGSSKVRLKIGDFRNLIDSLNYSRSWLTGGTAEEFRKQDIPGSLLPKIAQLQSALNLVPAKFDNDLRRAATAMEHAVAVIDHWRACQ